MQSGSSSPVRQRPTVLAEPTEVIVAELMKNQDQWYRIAGADYCRAADLHQPGCQCNVRVLTQTAYRIREKKLGAFAAVVKGCFKVVATSARNRPDRRYDVEIKAAYSRCNC